MTTRTAKEVLAEWASGNHDPMVLATMIAEPAQIKSGTLDAWVRDLDSYVLTDAFVALASQVPAAHKKAEKWRRAKGEVVGQTGWAMLSYLAGMDDDLPDEFFANHLETIEKEIHDRKNRVRHSMNGALISIGSRNAALRRKAAAAAKRIGKVEVDHGQTSCKTPAAIPYIDKIWERKRAKK